VKRVLLPSGDEMPLHEEPVYFLRWELVTTARLYDALPADVRRIGYSAAVRPRQASGPHDSLAD
jgi:hypothetical protein